MTPVAQSARSVRALSALLCALALGVAAGTAASAQSLPVTVPPFPSGDQAPGGTSTGAAETPLTGTFRLAAGQCGGAVSGSYFRMIQPGGNASGPFVSNSDSPCSDKTFTALSPGTDGGLVTGGYQPQPDPAFDGAGGGTAARITKPQRFYGVNFATATNPTDPQTSTKVPAPRISRRDDGSLTGDLRSFAASWNNQHFNQGSPKPDGSTPGATAGPTGTIGSDGRFTLDWTSTIVGGPFNNFTGLWHLEGTFAASSTSTTPGAAGSPSSTPSGGDTTAGAPTAGTASTGAATSTAGGAPSAPGAIARTGGETPLALAAIAIVVALAIRRARREVHA